MHPSGRVSQLGSHIGFAKYLEPARHFLAANFFASGPNWRRRRIFPFWGGAYSGHSHQEKPPGRYAGRLSHTAAGTTNSRVITL
jgi:hypothetical protein